MNDVCPVSAFPIRIGGKWTGTVVLRLEDGPRRFGDLRRRLRPISAKVLAETLLTMERDGFVYRRAVTGDDDQGVEYALTPLGRTLLDVIAQARGWARENLGELEHARRSFDRAADDRDTAACGGGTANHATTGGATRRRPR